METNCKKSLPLVLLAFLAVSTVLSGPAQAIVYVDHSSAGGDGSSWASAYKTLESAIAGSGANEEFWITGGTYTPTSTLYPEEGSKFYGGFTGTEAKSTARDSAGNPTIIDGQNNLDHIFYLMGGNVQLDGLTLTRGYANGSSQIGKVGGAVYIDKGLSGIIIANSTFSENSAGTGGAIYGWNTQVTISGCTFSNNSAVSGASDAKRGGAIWLYANTPTIENSTFSNNSAGTMGGAIELYDTVDAQITGCSFIGNTLTESGGGGAIAMQSSQSSSSISGTICNCTFDSNYSLLEGGAVYSNAFALTVRESTFTNNSAQNGGGIMMDYQLDQVSTVERCVFLNNSASSGGGGLYSFARDIEIENSLFAYNSGSVSGGGADFHSGDGSTYNANFSVTINNSTFYGNSTDGWGGATHAEGVQQLQIYNSIMWSNQAVGEFWDQSAGTYIASKDFSNSGNSSLITRYSDIETLNNEHGSSSETHTGSFSQDPSFTDPNGADNTAGTSDDDFSLSSSSPCIDRADGNYAPTCDLALYQREDNTRTRNQGTGSVTYADIGAYERIESSATGTCDTACAATTNVTEPSSSNSSGNIMTPINFLLLR